MKNNWRTEGVGYYFFREIIKTFTILEKNKTRCFLFSSSSLCAFSKISRHPWQIIRPIADGTKRVPPCLGEGKKNSLKQTFSQRWFLFVLCVYRLARVPYFSQTLVFRNIIWRKSKNYSYAFKLFSILKIQRENSINKFVQCCWNNRMYKNFHCFLWNVWNITILLECMTIGMRLDQYSSILSVCSVNTDDANIWLMAYKVEPVFIANVVLKSINLIVRIEWILSS